MSGRGGKEWVWLWINFLTAQMEKGFCSRFLRLQITMYNQLNPLTEQTLIYKSREITSVT